MPAFSFPSPLYAIADTLGRAELSWPELTRQMCAGGARLIQLRFKERSARDFLHIARQVRAICRQHGCLLIINDRADIARAIDADGLHIGQDDLPYAAARLVLGLDKIIGVSTHDPAQAVAAEREGADYIGFGPLFGTQTKTTGYTARGLDQLREIRNRTSLPVVAIGGITTERAPATLAAGANAVAMISDIVLSRQIEVKVRQTVQQLSPAGSL